MLAEVEREQEHGHAIPSELKIGAMLETPSLAYASDRFFAMTDFISVGGNDLKQFFFAADRENERVRRRYDMLSLSYLTFLEHIVAALRRQRHATLVLRRGCRPPDRGARPRGDRVPQPVDAPGLDRAGQGAVAPGRSAAARGVIEEARDAGAASVRSGARGLAPYHRHAALTRRARPALKRTA